jgi:hypothetical protein
MLARRHTSLVSSWHPEVGARTGCGKAFSGPVR